MLYRPLPGNAPYGIANRNTKLRGHASVAWLFGAAQDSKLQRTPPRSPLVDELHRHAESLIAFGSTDKRSRAPHTTPISLVDERSEEHTSELQSLMRSSDAVVCLKKKIT